MISCGNSNPPAATPTCGHVALANLFFQLLVTFVTVNIGSIAYVLPYSLKFLKLVFSERDAFSYCTLHRAVKFNASGHKCSEACCGFGATPAKMQAVVSVLDKNVCSYRRSNVKNIFPRNHTHFVFFVAFVEDCAVIEKDIPCQGNRGMSATKKKREVKICILRWLRCVQGNGQRCKFVLYSFWLQPTTTSVGPSPNSEDFVFNPSLN